MRHTLPPCSTTTERQADLPAEDRLREARAHVRTAKENYTAAINRRSTSQREVNELLQRKHAWSAGDLERFTHLYRNDHANEVAEAETQEAYSRAEREAEEAAAGLNKNILSRYHEEQVWSDKIRRMSTWGTWGLMGVNVLLFLIFQVAVEPWRRRRLVRGFEEKVLEALEREKLNGDEDRASVLDSPPEESVSLINETSDAPVDTTKPAESTQSTQSATDEPTRTALSRLSSLHQTSVNSWRQTLHDLFSERNLAITQRDLTTIAIQSAAAGAAMMGLVIAVIRPR